MSAHGASCAMSYMRAFRSTTGLKAGWIVTSRTRSPSTQISRPSRSPARYSFPLRIMPAPAIAQPTAWATGSPVKQRNHRGSNNPLVERERRPSRSSRRSEHDPSLGENRVVVVRVPASAVEIGGGAVKFVPQRVLQSDAHVEPWPEGRPAIAEWKIGDLGDPTGAVGSTGEGAVKRRIRGAADRHSPRRDAPGLIIDIGDRGVQGSQVVV